jgi:glycosyltransferase involved in cell wall biosynthesis
MAARLPIITSAGGIHVVIIDGKNSILLTDHNPVVIEKKIEKMLNNKAKHKEIRKLYSPHMNFQHPCPLFCGWLTLKNLVVDYYSSVLSPCPLQKMMHLNAENSCVESIKVSNMGLA